MPHRDGRSRSRLAINPDEPNVVRRIYSLCADYIDGTTNDDWHTMPLSCDAIAKLLNDEGHTVTVKTSRPRHDGTRFQTGERRPFHHPGLGASGGERSFYSERGHPDLQ